MNETTTRLTEAEALVNLKRYSVFGNADTVRRFEMSDGSAYYTGWIAGSLYTSHDGKQWEASGPIWRTG